MARPAFTLLEVMVATIVIGIGLIGAASLIVQNIQAQYINKTALIASQLAQEGLELVRNQRDENWVADNTWYAYTAGEDPAPGDSISFIIDYEGNINDSVGSITNEGARLAINSEGYYTHGTGSPTPFYRLITVENTGLGYLKVRCQVRSVERGRHYDYEAKTLLYNW